MYKGIAIFGIFLTVLPLYLLGIDVSKISDSTAFWLIGIGGVLYVAGIFLLWKEDKKIIPIFWIFILLEIIGLTFGFGLGGSIDKLSFFYAMLLVISMGTYFLGPLIAPVWAIIEVIRIIRHS